MNKGLRSGAGLAALAILSILAFLAVIAVNAAADIVPLNGVGTGALSDEIPNLFVPAGLTFAIWGLIYILLAGYSVNAAAEVFGKSRGGAWETGDGILFLVNAAANIGWIFAWHWRHVTVSLCLMLVILATLIALEERNARRLAAGGSLVAASPARRFFLAAPINVYLGWIMVATIANVTAFLVKRGWGGLGIDPRIWTVIVIAVGAFLAAWLAWARGAVAAPLVVIWAYAGIVIKRVGVDRSQSLAVWIAAIVAAVLVAVDVLLAQRSRRFSASGAASGEKP
jgi:hypothetical protein